jgi:hypothetical protein
MKIDFKFSIGDTVRYITTGTVGTIQGLNKFKNDPTQAMIEYEDNTGSVQSFWRNENDFELVE